MLKKIYGKNAYWLILTFLVILLDQSSKFLVSHRLALYEVKQEIPGFFSFILLHNQGAAFSFLNGEGIWASWGLGALALLVSVGLLVWMLRTPPQNKKILGGMALILGGALGNMLDRIFHGYVVDFLLFYKKPFYFPAFNLADASITVGAFLLILDMLFSKRDIPL